MTRSTTSRMRSVLAWPIVSMPLPFVSSVARAVVRDDGQCCLTTRWSERRLGKAVEEGADQRHRSVSQPLAQQKPDRASGGGELPGRSRQQATLRPDKEKRMSTKRTVQYIVGYVVGGLLVLVLIPRGLRRLSRAFDHLTGIQLIPITGLRFTLAVGLSLFGLLFGLWSIVVQNTVGKGGPLEVAGMEVSPKTQNLVVTGPYKYTRNPMLFGACVYYYAVAVYLNSVIAVAAVVSLHDLHVDLRETDRRAQTTERFRERLRRISSASIDVCSMDAKATEVCECMRQALTRR